VTDGLTDDLKLFSEVNLEKLVLLQVVKFLALDGSRRFITVFTTTCLVLISSEINPIHAL